LILPSKTIYGVLTHLITITIALQQIPKSLICFAAACDYSCHIVDSYNCNRRHIRSFHLFSNRYQIGKLPESTSHHTSPPLRHRACSSCPRRVSCHFSHPLSLFPYSRSPVFGLSGLLRPPLAVKQVKLSSIAAVQL